MFAQTIKELAEYFKLPVRTLQKWQKEYEETNWRRHLLKKLDDYKFLEEETKKELREIFDKNEIKALIACVNSTIPSNDFWALKKLWGYHIEECEKYEPMNITQFLPENADLEIFVKKLKDKINSLSIFQKYILFNEVFGFWKQKEKDLEEYIKNYR
ncbi:hypothetical protein [Caminibacter pacificus]|uniref:Uncharacterized protein n=1 Tax=Caminibacter pacificus TaxID=1424653 RepID=A0AAJ4UWY5_9BACT|nr:hypothetical protein [Caminibacter pacificus]QDD68199.1 hypothetical protein C6V80_10110 [Caminibacter pacificus]ROR38712.1 hypothetical protein EDC58_1927 [Caminibacter pacificus]